MRIEWDEAKILANQKSHGVSFEEASEVFQDDVNCLEIFDEHHSEAEERFIRIGPIRRGLVMVAWTERLDDVVRIISALGPPSGKQNATVPTWSTNND